MSLPDLQSAPPIGVRGVRQGEPVTLLFTDAAPARHRPASGVIARMGSMTLFGPSAAEVAATLCDELNAAPSDLRADDEQPKVLAIAKSGGVPAVYACSTWLTAADLNNALRRLAAS